MNREDKELDQLFRDASQQKTFEFKDEFWEEFERILPEKKGKKKIGVFWWLNSGLLVVAIISGGFFLSSKKASPQLAKNELNSVLSISSNSNIHHQNVAVPEMKNKKVNSITQKKSDKLDYISNTKPNYHNKISSINSITNNSEIKVLNNSKNQDNELVSSQKSDVNLNGIETLNTQKKAIEKSIVEVLNNNQEEIGLLDRKQFDLNLYPTYIKNGIYASKTKKWKAYIDGFYSVNQSPIINSTNGSNLSNGFGLGVGFIRSKSMWQLTGGLNVVAQQYSNLTINDRVKVYGFGVKNYQEDIYYRSLYTVEIPIYLGYSINNHSIQLGIVPGYLMATKLDYVLMLNNQIQEESSTYNYKKGLTNFMLKPSLKYSFKLAPTWQIGAMIQVQAISPIAKNIFTGIQNNHPLNGQLFIRKILY